MGLCACLMIIATEKDELIAAVERAHDKLGPLLLDLTKAVLAARDLTDFITAAQIRMAVGLRSSRATT